MSTPKIALISLGMRNSLRRSCPRSCVLAAIIMARARRPARAGGPRVRLLVRVRPATTCAVDTATERARLLAPGLVLVTAIVVVADRIPHLVSGTSALIWALALGAVIANTGLLRPSLAPGIRVASRRVLRVGVALLGIRL